MRSCFDVAPVGTQVQVEAFSASPKGTLGRVFDVLAEAEKEQFEVFALAGRTTALHALGRMEEYGASKRALVDEWSGQFPVIIGRVPAKNGEVDPALDLLESAVDAGLGGRIDPVDLAFDSLRGEPRWNAVLERLGKSLAQLDAIEFKVPRLPGTRDPIAPVAEA